MLGAILAWRLARVRLDDAYITFRYGENLARGRGPVFNPGEHVLGTTAPLHAALSAIVFATTGSATPTVMSVIGSLAWTAQAIALLEWLGGDPRARPLSLLAALPLACGIGGSFAWIPLETNLAFLASLLALANAARRRASLFGACSALACLLRPDGVVVMLLAGVSFARDRRALLRFALPPALAGAAWVGLATAYYGSPLPLTLRAKSGAVSAGAFVAFLFDAWPSEVLGLHVDAPIAAALWILAVVGAIAFVRARVGSLPAFALLHTALYALVLRPKTAFGWHVYPGRALFAIFVVVGIAEGIRVALKRRAAVPVTAVGAIACALGLVASLRFARSNATDYWYGERDRTYQLAADFLRPRLRAGDAIAAEEAGTLAYLTDARVYDFPRLVTPFALSSDGIEVAARAHGVRWVVVPAGLMPSRFPDGTRFHVVKNGEW